MTPARRFAHWALFWCLLASTAQIVATVYLGLAPGRALAAAAGEPPGPYAVAAAAVGAGGLAAYGLRRRPLLAAALVLLLEAGVLAPILRRMSWLGVAYHVELLAHHWAAVSAGVAALALAADLPQGMQAAPTRRRALSALASLIVGLAAVAGLAAHVVPHVAPDLEPWIHRSHAAASALLLAAVAFVWGVRTLQRDTLRAAAATALFLQPLAVRVVAGGTGALAGAAVPASRTPYVGAALIVAALTAYGVLRPRLPLALHAVVHLATGLSVGVLYVTYERSFGLVDGAFDELTRSFLGFPLPYPSYVPVLLRWLAAVGLFCVVATAYAMLLRAERRNAGLAFAVTVSAGVGLSSPQTVLMALAGTTALLSYDIVGSARRPAVAPPAPLPEVVADAAARLGLPSPVAVEGSRYGRWVTRGKVAGWEVTIRTEDRPRRPSIRVLVGPPPKGRPIVRLLPDPGTGGTRPVHPVAATHRIAGHRRRGMNLDDALFDALLAFPDATVVLHRTHARADLGGDLGRLGGAQLAGLVRALSAAVGDGSLAEGGP